MFFVVLKTVNLNGGVSATITQKNDYDEALKLFYQNCGTYINNDYVNSMACALLGDNLSVIERTEWTRAVPLTPAPAPAEEEGGESEG